MVAQIPKIFFFKSNFTPCKGQPLRVMDWKKKKKEKKEKEVQKE